MAHNAAGAPAPAAIADLPELAKTDKFYADLCEICQRHKNLWNLEAEKYVLANAKEI